jgi:TfoX/Sxy family transcriptional regulator of competence genes
MAYNEKLADRIRERLSEVRKVGEKEMMGGLTFMVNDKMCVGIFRDQLMCRINPAEQETALERTGAKLMEFNGRQMKGYVLIDDTGIKSKKDFDYWIGLALAFNKDAKSSKKKKPKKKA